MTPEAAPVQARLVFTAKPKATLFKFLTVYPDGPGGKTVEKWTTRFGTTFEKHIELNGVTTWWRLVNK